MVESLRHDIVIVGSGIAGLRAAIEAARVSAGKADIAVVTKVQAMRSHSVSAEGGTAAVLYPELGDSLESHAFDTVKGSDYLADQDAVERLVNNMPQEIYQLEHWGLPWSRRDDGRIAQRWFGGYSYPRATYAEDKVGFFEMQTLYDTAIKYDDIHFYQEWFATSILSESGEFRGITAIEMKTGGFAQILGKAGIVATGGSGRLYSFATYAYSSTPDGMATAYRAGIPLKDMEFIQFHPSGLIPSGILITEAVRGEGGVLVNKDGERFMKKYAPEKLDLASRDVVSRAMMTEIEAGRGMKDEATGLDYLHLDLSPIGAQKIKSRLSQIREIAIKFRGIDPVEEPLPVRPVCHYVMGGIDTDIDGTTRMKGLWAAGEAACVSVNGANRLGANSTAECLVWGKITGAEAANYAATRAPVSFSGEQVLLEEKRIFDGIFRGTGGTNPYEVRDALQKLMAKEAFVFRTGEGLSEALAAIRELKARDFLHCEDKSRVYNTNLSDVLEVESMLAVAEVVVVGALARTESRGAHYRRDYPRRDDTNWLKHTLAYNGPDGPRLDYSAVKITKYQPAERHY
ncbi:MAG TPA: succinate dehydrogenase/fumarate reductase flavoprotein subunit [Nitrososphaerales archaeon]|nr:succinate dehydrogenase/fumarate reductase flavoprotein subunit [Nitrososphaerales archaeon]